ncbi:MAG: ABC transporter permease subunit [Actinomycetota bacterium]|nr:ABC transporter permease subunit [Actinomycetota bacterium]
MNLQLVETSEQWDDRRIGFGQVMLAEWTKIRSVRSTTWSLVAFVVASVALSAGLCALIVANWSAAQGGGEPARVLADPTDFILGNGTALGQLAVCVLGVILITSEYSTGTIRASLLAVPGRASLLLAKAFVFATILLVLAEVVAFASFLVGSAVLHSRAPVSLNDPGVTRAVIGAGLYLAVLGPFSLAIGAIVRHTAGAILVVVGLVFGSVVLDHLVSGGWEAYLVAALPQQAGSLIYQAHPHPGQLLSAWQGFGIFCGWTVVLLAVAAALLGRLDP